MTKTEALDLLDQYADGTTVPDHLLAFQKDALEHARCAIERFPEDGSDHKSMRWLGFVQGVLVMAGIYSLDAVKEHSHSGKVA